MKHRGGQKEAFDADLGSQLLMLGIFAAVVQSQCPSAGSRKVLASPDDRLIEDFVPGDYYADTNQDNAMFVRWELQWKI